MKGCRGMQHTPGFAVLFGFDGSSRVATYIKARKQLNHYSGASIVLPRVTDMQKIENGNSTEFLVTASDRLVRAHRVIFATRLIDVLPQGLPSPTHLHDWQPRPPTHDDLFAGTARRL
jgi:thioredoxin reductase